jgi:hypothetical protein
MAKQAPPSFGLFAEGSSYTDRNRKPFEELWALLADHFGFDATLRIYGFDKSQILGMAPPRDVKPSRERLDVFVERMFQRDKFEHAIIAFDRIPSNEYLGDPCLRTEVNFLLKGLGASETLNRRFREEARRLLNLYEKFPQTPRGPGRPPRGSLDIIYMEPMFEGIFLVDEQSVLRGLGIQRVPKGWPKFAKHSHHPDIHILANAIRFAEPGVRNRVRGDLKSNKAGWALQIAKQAAADAALWKHEILQRLSLLLQP